MKKDKKGRPQDSKQKMMQPYVKHLDEETKDEVRSSSRF